MIKQNRLFKNKRGEDMLVDFWAILVFALIVLLFFILFAANKNDNKTNEITSEFASKDLEFILHSFLKAPAIGIDSQKTVADIIIEDYAADDYSRTNSLFLEYYSQTKDLNGNPIGAIYLSSAKETDIVIAKIETYSNIGKIEYDESSIKSLPNPHGGTSEELCLHKVNTILPFYDKTIQITFHVRVWYSRGMTTKLKCY